MSLLFWLLWVFDLSIFLLSFLGKGFRRSFAASDPALWFDFLLIGSLLGSLALRLIFKRLPWSLAAVALPVLVLLIWYLIDKATGSNP